tara:strand:- start:11 stop:370 length:360 start_codon:yes stop_codon:yes gene_type:complete
MRVYKISLPYPPSVNSLWRYSSRGVYRTPKYRDWLHTAGQGIFDAPAFQEPLKMTMRARAIDKRRRDIDNIIKPVCDLFEHQNVVVNDFWIQHLDVSWDQNINEGTVKVLLMTLEESLK